MKVEIPTIRYFNAFPKRLLYFNVNSAETVTLIFFRAELVL